MGMRLLLCILCAATAFVATVNAATCEGARATPSWYSTKDAFFHFSTTFIVEFVLHCQNDPGDLQLYAEVNGRLLPAAVSEETSKYQVSWTEEHDKAPAGTYVVSVFDEDGHAAIRKAQRNNEDIAKVKPLFSVPVEHQGATKGPWVSTETVALLVALLISYFAFSWKSAIQS